jgi:ABC-2 type transport system ATP-binding protein
MTTGLDPNARREVWDLVEQVRREGATVVLVTHFMDEAQRLCDRIAVMARGRIVAQGSPVQVVRDYGGGTRASFDLPGGAGVPDLRSVAGVDAVEADGGRVEVRGNGAFLVGLGHALTVAGLSDVELTVNQPSLEDAYVRLVTEETE